MGGLHLHVILQSSATIIARLGMRDGGAGGSGDLHESRQRREGRGTERQIGGRGQTGRVGGAGQADIYASKPGLLSLDGHAVDWIVPGWSGTDAGTLSGNQKAQSSPT